MYHERQDLEDEITKWESKARTASTRANICKTAVVCYLGAVIGFATWATDTFKLVAIIPAVGAYTEFRVMKKSKEEQTRFQHRADYRKQLIESTWKDNSSNL